MKPCTPDPHPLVLTIVETVLIVAVPLLAAGLAFSPEVQTWVRKHVLRGRLNAAERRAWQNLKAKLRAEGVGKEAES